MYYLAEKSLFDALKKYAARDQKIILQCGVGTSAKVFKKAVDRNRIKRLMRESYRLQKIFLADLLEENKLQMAIFVIYIGRDLPEYKSVSDKMELILHRLAKEIV